MSSNRAPEAEKYLKHIADNSKEAAPKIALADYYLLVNRKDEALKLLQGISSEKDAFVPAKSRIAAVQFADGKKDDAYTTVNEVLGKEPKNAAALLVKARFLAADGKLDEALPQAQAAVAAIPIRPRGTTSWERCTRRRTTARRLSRRLAKC